MNECIAFSDTADVTKTVNYCRLQYVTQRNVHQLIGDS